MMDASLFIVLGVWLSLFVLLPAFREKTKVATAGPEELLPGFRAELGSVLAGLSDLEEDMATGKLSPEEYQAMRGQLEQRMLETIRWAGYEQRFLDEREAPRWELLLPLRRE